MPPLSVSPPPPSDAGPEALQDWFDVEIAKLAAAIEGRMVGIVEAAITRYSDAIGLQADAAAFDGMASAWRAWLNAELAPYFTALHMEAGLAAIVGVDVPAVIETTWYALVNDNAIAYAREATNRLVNTGDDVWAVVRGKVQEGITFGLSSDDVRKRIEDVTGYTEFRADAIARTEVVGAYVNGDRQAAAALGEFGPVEHYWMATSDSRTRETHVAADGQVQPFNVPFQVGSVQMMHPHAAGAPAREVVNCRCVEGHLYPGDTRPDGSKVPGGRAEAASAYAPPPIGRAPLPGPPTFADLGITAAGATPRGAAPRPG